VTLTPWIKRLRRAAPAYVRPVDDDEQSYCDWCFGDLTEKSRRQCVAIPAYELPPDSWVQEDDYPWPFRRRVG
jgi:hypothetical protein